MLFLLLFPNCNLKNDAEVVLTTTAIANATNVENGDACLLLYDFYIFSHGTIPPAPAAPAEAKKESYLK